MPLRASARSSAIASNRTPRSARRRTRRSRRNRTGGVVPVGRTVIERLPTTGRSTSGWTELDFFAVAPPASSTERARLGPCPGFGSAPRARRAIRPWPPRPGCRASRPRGRRVSHKLAREKADLVVGHALGDSSLGAGPSCRRGRTSPSTSRMAQDCPVRIDQPIRKRQWRASVSDGRGATRCHGPRPVTPPGEAVLSRGPWRRTISAGVTRMRGSYPRPRHQRSRAFAVRPSDRAGFRLEGDGLAARAGVQGSVTCSRGQRGTRLPEG